MGWLLDTRSGCDGRENAHHLDGGSDGRVSEVVSREVMMDDLVIDGVLLTID